MIKYGHIRRESRTTEERVGRGCKRRSALLEIMLRQHPGYERPIMTESGILLAAKAIRKSFGKKYYLPLYKYPILIDFGTPDGQICVVHPSNFVCYTAPFLRRISAAFSYSVVPAVYKETTAGRESFRRWK